MCLFHESADAAVVCSVCVCSAKQHVGCVGGADKTIYGHTGELAHLQRPTQYSLGPRPYVCSGELFGVTGRRFTCRLDHAD